MCGIAGAVFWSGSTGGRRSAEIVSAMTDALGHRGPDGRGVVTCKTSETTQASGPSVALGHTRLAILDLSDSGAQPMKQADAPVWITFNGEIFNFRAVREDLERCGRRFHSDSDTEVILQGYGEWGAGVIDRLQGMFAFAIWDQRRGEVLLARDRLGVKPLYVYQNAGVFVFASEVRALLASGVVPRQLDRVALRQYLAYQTVPSPRTLVAGIRMVLPGHSLSVTADRLSERAYWDLLANADGSGSAAGRHEVKAHVGALLEQSAALHMVSDVPVGIFLSGGIDSSALVSLARRVGVTPRTFSVVLPGTPHDEAVFARTIASEFEAEHAEIAIGERELTGAAPEALAHVDHPSGDGLNTYVIARAVRAAGLKVAWSGLGGDEMFGGYPSFDRLGKLARYSQIWKWSPAAVRHAAAAAVRAFGGSSIASGKAASVLERDGSLAQTFPVTRELFSAADRQALLEDDATRTDDPYVNLIEHAVDQHPAAGLMSLVTYAESRTYMHDVLLRDADQMSMAHALEVRVPLLDHRLAEYVMGLPDAVKAPDGLPKRLLVESLRSPLPAACVERPKQGFVLPFDQWMRGELRQYCEHHLGPDGLEGRGLFHRTALQSLWRAYLAGGRSTTWSRPWTLVALDAWLEHNRIAA